MTPEHTALVARLEKAGGSFAPSPLATEAAAAIRALAGEVERLMVENAMLKADPLHTMLMAQATQRLQEIHRLQAVIDGYGVK